MRITAAAVCTAALTLLVPAVANAATYYVRGTGNDASSGTSPATAWRTVSKVNNAPLAPGDTVLFEGGSVFADSLLMPSRSGTAAAPITYSSFGAATAQLPQGIWMMSVSWLRLENLAIDGPSTAISSSSNGTGVSDIAITNNQLSNVSVGVLAPHHGDTRWTISGNTISHTGDSGLILQGSSFLVSGNTITDTGANSSIAYGKHGIYAKGPGMRLIGNTIAGFQANGISTRFQNAIVEGNTISGGPIGIAYFQDGTAAGTSRLSYNRISGVSSTGIYLDGSTLESFVIANNTISMSAGSAMDLRAVANLTLANNVVTGSVTGFNLYVKAPAGAYSEHHNLWHSSAGPAWFAWNGTTSLNLSSYRSLSGNGAGDFVANPALGASFVPSAGSPVVDAGSASVSSLTYAGACDGLALHFCGLAPDVGAVETGATALPAMPPSGLVASPLGATGATLTWIASPDPRVVGYSVTANGAARGFVSSTTFVAAGLACGTTYAFEVRATTAGGGVSAPVSVSATTGACSGPGADALPPAVTITVPRNGAVVSLSPTVFATTTDASGVRDVTFSADGVRVCVDSSAPYSCKLRLHSGWHTLTARATDRVGNSASASVRVRASANLAHTLGARAGGALHRAANKRKRMRKARAWIRHHRALHVHVRF
ncbi:MAG: right-handed parallel beta-helix repeat-containing protein [Actinomycetota bacterium]|nr:right-handed parallel beta-helix repeat-containing protein [Actinomycetota bacterium]